MTAAPTVGSPLTGAGRILGTFQYMAPEQIEGQEADARTDIFAFGAVVYEMVTGKRAFEGKSQASLMAAILEREPPPVSRVVPTVPPAIDRIVMTCLEKDPADRWQSSRDLLRQLQWTANERMQSSATASSSRPMTRRRWLALGSLAVGVVAISLWLLALDSGPPVIVLMDSTHPERVYDPITRAQGGTNADDLTNVLRDLPVVLVKENTNATWNREDEVLRQNPALIVVHRSCFYDATFGGNAELGLLTNPLALDKFDMFIGFIGQGNPRTKFLVYSRGAFGNDPANQQTYVNQVEARFPALRGRVRTWQVPLDRATYRDPMTAAEIREQVEAFLEF